MLSCSWAVGRWTCPGNGNFDAGVRRGPRQSKRGVRSPDSVLAVSYRTDVVRSRTVRRRWCTMTVRGSEQSKRKGVLSSIPFFVFMAVGSFQRPSRQGARQSDTSFLKKTFDAMSRRPLVGRSARRRGRARRTLGRHRTRARRSQSQTPLGPAVRKSCRSSHGASKSPDVPPSTILP